MNSEERHEMEQNELVKALAGIKTANRRKIAIGVGLAALVFGIVFFIRYMNHLTAANDADRWVRLQSATDKDSLQSLMDLYRGKEAGTIAKMKYARLLLTNDGLQKLPTTDAKCFAAVEGGDFKGYVPVKPEFYNAIIAARKSAIGG